MLERLVSWYLNLPRGQAPPGESSTASAMTSATSGSVGVSGSARRTPGVTHAAVSGRLGSAKFASPGVGFGAMLPAAASGGRRPVPAPSPGAHASDRHPATDISGPRPGAPEATRPSAGPRGAHPPGLSPPWPRGRQGAADYVPVCRVVPLKNLPLPLIFAGVAGRVHAGPPLPRRPPHEAATDLPRTEDDSRTGTDGHVP